MIDTAIGSIPGLGHLYRALVQGLSYLLRQPQQQQPQQQQ
jgi:hypothetical protein